MPNYQKGFDVKPEDWFNEGQIKAVFQIKKELELDSSLSGGSWGQTCTYKWYDDMGLVEFSIYHDPKPRNDWESRRSVVERIYNLEDTDREYEVETQMPNVRLFWDELGREMCAFFGDNNDIVFSWERPNEPQFFFMQVTEGERKEYLDECERVKVGVLSLLEIFENKYH